MDKDINNRYRTITINGQLYRLNEYIDKDAKSIHHIIGKCNRLKYNTNADINKVLINDRKHKALNAFFGDKQDPRSQLLEVFNLVKPVLSPGVRQELYTILEMTDDDMFYSEEVLKNGKKRTKKGK